MKPIRKSETLSTPKAAGKLDSLIDRLQDDSLPIIIRNANENKAVLISMEDYEMFLESMNGLDKVEEELSHFAETYFSDTVFSTRPSPVSDDYSEIFQFRITLQEVKPAVWRRIQVPANYTFWDLHVAIQDAMGWDDSHIHAFHIDLPDNRRLEISSMPLNGLERRSNLPPDWEILLADHMSTGIREFRYIYDFGDNWVHLIELEEILPRDSETDYPMCLDGKRACPPEDCGGPFGYHNLLQALNNPRDEDFGYWHDWIGEGFDPDHFSTADIYFDDPEDRWEDLFGSDEFDDEFKDLQEDDARLQLLRMTREHMTKTWQRVQNDELEDLTPEDKKIAHIMQEHKDVLFDEFSVADLNPEHDYDPDTEVNPFLHITVHAIVEQQIEDRNPVEAFQFFNAMCNKKCAPHDAIHLVGLILTPLIFRVLKRGDPFDMELYTRLLKKYKNRNPAKIPGLIEDDPDWAFE